MSEFIEGLKFVKNASQPNEYALNVSKSFTIGDGQRAHGGYHSALLFVPLKVCPNDLIQSFPSIFITSVQDTMTKLGYPHCVSFTAHILGGAVPGPARVCSERAAMRC